MGETVCMEIFSYAEISVMEASVTASRGIISASVEKTLLNRHLDGSLYLESTIKWSRFILQVLGIWPNSNDNWSLHIQFFLTIFFLLCLNVPQIIYFIKARGQFDLMIETLTKAIAVTITALVKVIAVWNHGKVLSSLLSHVNKDWMMLKDKREWEVMIKGAKVARTISIGGIVITFGALSLHIFNYILTNILTQVTSKQESLFRAEWPFETDKSPNYEITFVVQVVGGVYTGMAYIGIDIFLETLILHVCYQFINLRLTLQNMIADAIYKEKIEIRQQLTTFVRRHQQLNRFAELIEESFNVILLVHMVFCALQLCIIGYSFILNKEHSERSLLPFYHFAFLTAYAISGLLQLFVYCYVGEMLNAESTELSNTAYQCEWYKLRTEEAQDLMFIMLRAKSPLQITAGKFCSISISTFSDVLKTSLGYLSMLLSVQNGKI